jgi:photoactive yellow protein
MYPFLERDDASDADSPTTGSDTGAPAASSSPDAPAQGGGVSGPLHFGDDGVGEQLRHATEKQLNDVQFGIIKVDDEGVVEFFNRYESELSGVDPDDAVGRNFFTQVAPCTNNRLFRGRFKKGLRRDDLDETFTYTYTYKMRPTLVDVHLYRDDAGHNWIMVQKY